MPLTKKENRISHASPSALKSLFLAARPRTWSASLCPVLIGTVIAAQKAPIKTDIFLLTLLFSLFIQIGTNYANDYFDFIKNADTEDRIGPKRAVQQGWIAPKTMLLTALFTFALALVAAIPLMLSVGLWSLGAALLCVLFGILYTGGPRPLGYLGLGEILVFSFFGPVAVLGSYFLQTGAVGFDPLIASFPPGLIAAAILIANNLRDEITDRPAGKKTIVVRFGRRFGSCVYALCFAGAVFSALPFSKLAALSLFASLPLISKTFRFQKNGELIAVLQGTSMLLSIYTILFCLSMMGSFKSCL
jgi:1,4-dihydroxy-2-naphthoate octaprenyltransferase